MIENTTKRSTERSANLAAVPTRIGSTSSEAQSRLLAGRVADTAQRYGLLLVWALVVVFFTVINGSGFLSTANFLNIFNSQAVLVLLTLALLGPLIIGELDISFAAVMGVSAVGMGYLNVIHGWPIVFAVLASLAIGLVVGSINALLIVKADIDAIVVTLGMGTLLTGLAFAMSSLPISGVDSTIVSFFGVKLFGLQLGFWIAVAACVVVWYVLGYTPVGRYLYFVGAGRDAARLAGIPVNRIRAITLIIASVIAAMAGVMLTSLLGAADPTVGPSYMLPAFSAAFLGTTAIAPGRFNPWGSFIAVYFLVTGITGLQIAGFSGWVEQAFYGVALLIAVVLARWSGTRGEIRG